jgi:hypothetical protein
MSAASPARSPQRDAAPAAASPAKAKRPGFSFAAADSEDHFKLNLSDIPKMPYSMEVESLKPSLLARLVGKVVGSK